VSKPTQMLCITNVGGLESWLKLCFTQCKDGESFQYCCDLILGYSQCHSENEVARCKSVEGWLGKVVVRLPTLESVALDQVKSYGVPEGGGARGRV
jgi:hypothetical protein